MRSGGRPRRALPWVLVAAGLLAFGLADVRQRARLDRGVSKHRTDFTVYLAASQALEDGTNPYEARSPRGWRYVYPPLLAILLRPLLGLPVPDAAFGFFLLSAVLLLLSGRWIARAIGPPEGHVAATWALLLCAPFLVQTFQRGQVTVLLLAAQSLALVLLLARRDVLAGLVLAAGVVLRLTPLLPAGMVGLACVRAALQGRWREAWRFPAGLVAGLVLGFVVLPTALLGPARALEVTRQWIDTGRDVYAAEPGRMADLDRDFEITEFTHKNQSVRRVLGTLSGVAPTGADEPPRPEDLAGVDVAATAVAAAVLLLACVLGWRMPADRGAGFRRLFAVGVVLPVLVTRYVWPVHHAVTPLLLAECTGGLRTGWHRGAAAALVGGEALYYLGHLAPLRPLADVGPLLAGTVAAVALVLSRRAEPGAQP